MRYRIAFFLKETAGVIADIACQLWLDITGWKP